MFIATGLALIVIGLGAYTRLTDAGLGCPDWPGCYGHLFEPNNFLKENFWTTKAWTEMIHRYVAGSLGLLILVLFFFSLRYHFTLPSKVNNETSFPIKIPCLLLVLIICQALLGMWTVTLKLHPTIVMAHLLGGFTTLTLLWLYYLQLKNYLSVNSPFLRKAVILPNYYKPLTLLCLITVILQIALGGWTSANYAALACLDFPQCQASWLPAHNFSAAFTLLHPIGPNFEFGLLDNAARITIHMTHRFGALLTTLLLTLTCGIMLKTNISSLLRKTAWVIIALLCLQVALGITNILAILPLPIAVMHNMVAALLLLSVVTLTYYVFISRRTEK